MKIFLLILSLIFPQLLLAQQPATRLIALDAGLVKGKLDRSYNFCVGAGRANEGLRADWQRQLRQTKQELGFRYIRFHGLLTNDMGVYQEDKKGNPIYNWQYLDELFDFLQSINIKPFVELGFMPNALASGNKTVFWWKGNITPPKDYQKWNGLIKNLLLHWKQRYGETEVKTWYFEVWNEPNLKDLFFSGNQEDYFKLYQETAKTIKAVSKDFKVGGPATAGNAWIPEFINFCVVKEVPVDFISTHTYGVKQGFLDQTGDVGTIVSQDKNAVSSDMIHTKEIIQKSALPNLELHYTEWSSSYTPTDPIHDNYQEAAYILDKIKKASASVNSMSYWTFTDIFEELGPRMTPFHGGFGLMNYQDIKKPAYYAYQYLNQLGDQELVNNDASSIATKSKNGNLQLLLWDFTITHPGDSVNDQVYFKRDLPAKTIAPAQISIRHLAAGKYQIQLYKTGYRSNDAYASFIGLKSPPQLTREQVTQIKKQNDNRPISTVTVQVKADGKLEKELPMRENDVLLLSVKKM
ncbi:GH39 family glycosyl hydrolase [Mucilaginibacter arboris]|uniref:Glycoside hydrolase n=1 Tax=Mucilaginibacter arboris TaxID=2682090 RepID=A0A7K1SXJ0_9SPHI|nr:glycoside hydrolase [Mucilaginibacter arboris]MVN22034.1 glycoside hydrolase [Mucilaginibacter arboris]